MGTILALSRLTIAWAISSIVGEILPTVLLIFGRK